MTATSVEVTLPTTMDFWWRHLIQINTERRYMNAFTRWRPSALYPLRRYFPKPQVRAVIAAKRRKASKSDDLVSNTGDAT